MIRQFYKNERGNIAMMFAGSMMVICSVVGVSVDYARVLNDQQKAQNILDASVFSTAAQYQEHGKRNLSKRIGTTHFTSSLPEADPDKLQFAISNREISGTYQGTTKHYFLSIFTSESSQWQIEANLKYGKTYITDFALAIDVSASMDNYDLIAPLRRNLKRFSEKAFAKANPGDVSVSMIPFSNSIAFPPEFDRWLDPKEGYSQAEEFKGCFEHQSIFDTALLKTNGHANRIATYDRRLQPKGKNIPFCPEEESYVSFFHETKQDLNEKVEKLTTSFGTNTSEGLLWARRILAPEWQGILNQSKTFPRSYKPEHNKVIILLTDGRPYQLSTIKSESVEAERAKGQEKALADFKEVCKQIIDEEKVDLYTIVYGDLMTEDQRNEIRSCIAGRGRSFWASATSLDNVFRRILAMNNELALTR